MGIWIIVILKGDKWKKYSSSLCLPVYLSLCETRIDVNSSASLSQLTTLMGKRVANFAQSELATCRELHTT